MSKQRVRHHLNKCLIQRQYSVLSTRRLSNQALRCVILGPKRYWKQSVFLKKNISMETSLDYLWMNQLHSENASGMFRMNIDGSLQKLYSILNVPKCKEHLIYDVPHPVFSKVIDDKEYRPTMFVLRKDNILTRHDLKSGQEYNRIEFSSADSLSWSLMTDRLVIKSSRVYKSVVKKGHFQLTFFVFDLHPFSPFGQVTVDSEMFPAVVDQKRLGRLRTAEMSDGLLTVLTNKDFVLLYDADQLMQKYGDNSSAQNSVPLFVTSAFIGDLSIGGCPWTCINALDHFTYEVRDINDNKLIEGGKIEWSIGNEDQQFKSSSLIFHSDDSNRLIHFRSSDIRILSLKTKNGNRILEEDFRHPKLDEVGTASQRFSRCGRALKSRINLNDLNRLFSFDFDDDLNILVIVEATRDMENGCSDIVCVSFFDNETYELIKFLPVGIPVAGDIELSRLSVGLDADVLSLLWQKDSAHTIISFRINEEKDELIDGS